MLKGQFMSESRLNLATLNALGYEVLPVCLDDRVVPRGTAIRAGLVEKMAAEQGIDLRTLRGSGPGGRIVKRDLEKALHQAAAFGPAAAVGVQGPAAPPFMPAAGSGGQICVP